jgi:hypothetical protein
VSAVVTAVAGGGPGTEISAIRVAFHEVIEVALPLAHTGTSLEMDSSTRSARETTRLDFKVAVLRGTMLVELLPERGSISLDLA